jgi:hypothetical protein
LVKGKHSIYEPWQIIFYLSVAIVAGIIASLLTSKPKAQKIKLFHDLIGTPVKFGEIVSEPCTLPEGVEPSNRKRWFKGTSFEICAPSKISYLGFAVSWIAVGMMIFIFKIIIEK